MLEENSLVVSANSLTDEETQIRLDELAAWGVDLSLVQANLARTPTERIEHMLQLLHFAQALRQGYLDAARSNVDDTNPAVSTLRNPAAIMPIK